MRDLKDYSPGEWGRMIPFLHFFKELRNDALQNTYLAMQPRSLKLFLEKTGNLRDRNLGLVIAYEQPWSINWLMKMAARNVSGATLIVFDNSRGQGDRREIERICRDQDVLYLALPRNPASHPNRSHGIAMTWIFHNVVRAIRPRMFGFIDHDLIPMEKIAFGESLGDQPFYGIENVSSWGWQLWAGYCLYNFSAVHELHMNFLNDVTRCLDTGGRNWSCLYKNHDRTQLRFGERKQVQVMDPLNNIPRTIEVVDDRWLHLVGASYSSSFREMFGLYERIAKAADEGATLQLLVKKSMEGPSGQHPDPDRGAVHLV